MTAIGTIAGGPPHRRARTDHPGGEAPLRQPVADDHHAADDPRVHLRGEPHRSGGSSDRRGRRRSRRRRDRRLPVQRRRRVLIFVYMMVVAVMAMSQSFAFALGFGVHAPGLLPRHRAHLRARSRRSTPRHRLLGAIERATNGWGLGGRMFTPMYFGDEWYVQVFACSSGCCCSSSSSAASRARSTCGGRRFGVTLFCRLIALAAGRRRRPADADRHLGGVRQFFADAGFVGCYASSLVPTVIAAVAGFLVLRRATPRS